jgi:hypothetical protein
MIFTRFLIFSVLFFSTQMCCAGPHSFRPLSEEEYPTERYTLKFSQQCVVDPEKVRRVIEIEPTVGQYITYDTIEKQIYFRFNPFIRSFDVKMPENLPKDVRLLIMSMAIGKPIPMYDARTFGTFEEDIKIGSENGSIIGSRSVEIMESPSSLVDNIGTKVVAKIVNEALIKTWEKNPEIAEFVRFILTSPRKKVRDDLTIENIENIMNLVASVYGGEIKRNPPSGLALEVQIPNSDFPDGIKLEIPTQNGHDRVYKKLLKRETKKFLSSFHLHHGEQKIPLSKLFLSSEFKNHEGARDSEGEKEPLDQSTPSGPTENVPSLRNADNPPVITGEDFLQYLVNHLGTLERKHGTQPSLGEPFLPRRVETLEEVLGPPPENVDNHNVTTGSSKESALSEEKERDN